MNAHYNDDNHIKFSWPDLTDEEINEVVDTLRSGWITTGPKTKKLEQEIAEYIGSPRAVCLNSATAAEELNLRVLGIGSGDEVIVPALTYTATASAVIHVGAKPVMVDIKVSASGTPEMDYDAVENAITERTKAIIPVDIYGIPCDYTTLYRIVEEKKSLFAPSSDIQKALGRIAIVSDCAHALGASRTITLPDGTKELRRCGQLADFTSFSFHAVKNLTTAEGGAAVWRSIPGIDDDELYHQYMLLSLHGQSKDAFSKNKGGGWEYDILGHWYKCNMTDILASLGLGQLRRYPGMLERRKEMIEYFDKRMDEAGVIRLTHYGSDWSSSGHLYITRTPWLTEGTRNEVIQELASRHVPVNVHYKPLPMMTAYKNLGFDIKQYSHAYDYYKNLITLSL
jgi:dTDP-4-amino-4,6-dideoxygalactose transaminase